MRIICITIGDDYQRMGGLYGPSPVGVASMSRTRQHFADRGVDAQFFLGIHAENLGVTTTLNYEIDRPGSGFKIGFKKTGCWLSHRALWAACLLIPDDIFLVLEDDAIFPPDWKPRLEQALSDAGEADVLYVGSCCTEGKPTKRVAGDVYDVQWPFCTHAYVVRKRALPILIETQDAARCYAPIDISMTLHSFDRLCVRTVKPRIIDQFDTEISP